MKQIVAKFHSHKIFDLWRVKQFNISMEARKSDRYEIVEMAKTFNCAEKICMILILVEPAFNVLRLFSLKNK